MSSSSPLPGSLPHGGEGGARTHVLAEDAASDAREGGEGREGRDTCVEGSIARESSPVGHVCRQEGQEGDVVIELTDARGESGQQQQLHQQQQQQSGSQQQYSEFPQQLGLHQQQSELQQQQQQHFGIQQENTIGLQQQGQQGHTDFPQTRVQEELQHGQSQFQPPLESDWQHQPQAHQYTQPQQLQQLSPQHQSLSRKRSLGQQPKESQNNVNGTTKPPVCPPTPIQKPNPFRKLQRALGQPQPSTSASTPQPSTPASASQPSTSFHVNQPLTDLRVNHINQCSGDQGLPCQPLDSEAGAINSENHRNFTSEGNGNSHTSHDVRSKRSSPRYNKRCARQKRVESYPSDYETGSNENVGQASAGNKHKDGHYQRDAGIEHSPNKHIRKVGDSDSAGEFSGNICDSKKKGSLNIPAISLDICETSSATSSTKDIGSASGGNDVPPAVPSGNLTFLQRVIELKKSEEYNKPLPSSDQQQSTSTNKQQQQQNTNKQHEQQHPNTKHLLQLPGDKGSNSGNKSTKGQGNNASSKGSHKSGSGGQSKADGQRQAAVVPSTNWRRLRTLVKFTNEMQAPKKNKHTLTREDSFLRKFSTRNHQQNNSTSTDEEIEREYLSRARVKSEGRFVLQHDGNFMFYWLGVVTLAVMYNVWTCIAREGFVEIQQSCQACWWAFDALADSIYILDIVVRFRTGYLDQGLMVYDSKKLRQRYLSSRVVFVDFLCLLPLDLLQFQIGVHPMIRFPRFLKVYRTFYFVHMLESRSAYPNLIRVATLTGILLLGTHWFAAFYYMISEAEGFQGEWAYPEPVGDFADVNRKYLRSLFWSTLTLTTIGDLPPPDNTGDLRMSNAAYVFVIVSYLIGVFVFATIVGQVGNVINNRNASRQEFERLLDGAKIYMQTHSVPHNLQKRVQRWYDYVWSRGRLNGCDINSLGLLPDKLKTELAIHVNLETLKKVTIFQECQPEFLHDLVLKMKAYIFTPGDLICRRGEVAREMFIIADGVVEIISETGVMLKRMGAGDFFGEIGILNLDGGINRRTADVRSVGYLELFVLSREDVLAALKDHPEAESIIRDYGQRRLREVEAHRQKVKPLKSHVKQDPAVYQSAKQTGESVQNRLLMTLRSLNPTVRRLSTHPGSNCPHPGSPPGGGANDVKATGNRRSSSQEELPVSTDELSAEVKAKKLKPNFNPRQISTPNMMERENSGGRSHAMSIIQQPASDLSHQEIRKQIMLMQTMIEKRLSSLEDVYHTTSDRLDKLTSSQEVLLRLLKQQILRPINGPDGTDDDDLTPSTV